MESQTISLVGIWKGVFLERRPLQEASILSNSFLEVPRDILGWATTEEVDEATLPSGDPLYLEVYFALADS